MNILLDDDVERHGFARAATAIALRTISTCPMLGLQPPGRAVIGVALFSVMPTSAGYRFLVQSHALRNGAMPADLLDWLEERLPATGLILAHEADRLRATVAGALDKSRRPRIAALLANADQRLCVIPSDYLRGAPRCRAYGMPCLCGPGHDCRPALPPALLPDPDETETGLRVAAAAIWERWARHHAAFADDHNLARAALQAFAEQERSVCPAPSHR